MNHSNFKHPASIILIMAVFALSFFYACEEDDTTENNETETWEPYQVKPNTAFEYDFEKYENDTLSSSGNFRIEVGDPEVTITGTIDGEEFEVIQNDSDDPEENFKDALLSYPYTGALYHNAWPSEFDPEEVEVGDSWSYTYGGETLSFNVTGKETYAGYEGYVVKMEYQDESITQSWEACVNKNIPLALMSRIIDNEEEWSFELTNYEE
ncbi:MAG: hypothetical protein R6U04_00590 [Bacteroidales bacterium]